MQHILDIIIACINVLFTVGYVAFMLMPRFEPFTVIVKMQLQSRAYRWFALLTMGIGLILNWAIFNLLWDMPYTLWSSLVSCIAMAWLMIHLYQQGLKAELEQLPFHWN